MPDMTMSRAQAEAVLADLCRRFIDLGQEVQRQALDNNVDRVLALSDELAQLPARMWVAQVQALRSTIADHELELAAITGTSPAGESARLEADLAGLYERLTAVLNDPDSTFVDVLGGA